MTKQQFIFNKYFGDQKKDGTIWICSAPIEFNAATIDDGQLLSNMRELIDVIAGAKF